jgi:hypothetical protein
LQTSTLLPGLAPQVGKLKLMCMGEGMRKVKEQYILRVLERNNDMENHLVDFD